MKIFLDTAEVDMIRPAYQTGLINGVTTNPTLIRKSGRDPIEVIKEMSVDFPNLQSISAEVVADTAEEMVDQAQAFNGFWNVTIKVPCTVEGLKACTALAATNYKVNVTLIFSAAQAILAEKAGSLVAGWITLLMVFNSSKISVTCTLVVVALLPLRFLEHLSVMFVR
jgi:transaldolase